MYIHIYIYIYMYNATRCPSGRRGWPVTATRDGAVPEAGGLLAARPRPVCCVGGPY